MSTLASCVIILHPASYSVDNPPDYKFNQKNFISCTHLHICPLYMHIKYLVHIAHIFNMTAILLLSFICPSCQHGLTWSFHIWHNYLHRKNFVLATNILKFTFFLKKSHFALFELTCIGCSEIAITFWGLFGIHAKQPILP